MKERSSIKYIAIAVIALAVLVLSAVAVTHGIGNSDAKSDLPQDGITVSTAPDEETVGEVTTTTEATSVTTTVTTTEATTTEITATEATTTEATTTEETTAATTEVTTVSTTEATTVITTEATAAKEPEYGDAGVVVINEVCASNKKSILDYEGDNPDWVELYNPSKLTVNLKGYGISDDPEQPFKWTLPDAEIEAGGYLIIFCSDKDSYSNGELHTNFKLSAGSESVYLTSPLGSTQDQMLAAEADKDMSYARYPDGSKTYKLISATPNKSNESTDYVDESVLQPVFSKKSGFYDKQFSLTISADPDTTIYYTTDGSVPTTSSEKYSSSITIKDRSSSKAIYTYKKGITVNNDEFPKTEFEKATIVRAIAVDKNGHISDVTTATYFVSADIAKKYSNVRVMSVVIDPDDLFNYETGIYVAGKTYDEWRKENPSGTLDGSTPANFNQRGSDWERAAHIELFDGTSLEFAENVGVRIHGGWSRNNMQKSMRFYFRSEYGTSKLKYELFDDNYSLDDGKIIKTYKRFMLRNGGNDTYLLKFKDPWIQSLFKETRFAFSTQADELVVCFLDGEYWGVYTMNEVLDKNYIEEHYGIVASDVISMKAGELDEGEEGEESLFYDAVSFIKHNDMSNAENYAKACEMFDMDSFCQYIAAETYIGNEDWLWNNWLCWRSRTVDTETNPYSDGKWRFVMYDVEYSQDLYGNGNNYKADYISKLLSGDGHFGKMFASLVKNEDFLNKLVIAYCDVMNIAFDPDFATAKLVEYYETYSTYLNDHFNRFVTWQSVGGISKNAASWKKWVENRYNYFPTLLAKTLDLKSSKTYKLTINTTEGGTVTVNGHYPYYTASKDGTSTWDGTYFEGYKLSLEAVPDEGYEFVGWSGGYDGTSAKIKASPKSAFTLTAQFKKK